jgi:hypothetical protein
MKKPSKFSQTICRAPHHNSLAMKLSKLSKGNQTDSKQKTDSTIAKSSNSSIRS